MQAQTKIKTNLTDWLLVCQRNFGKTPRSFSWIDKFRYISVATPAWARNDTLKIFFKNQNRLMSQGELVWGNIIQANNCLFMPGDCSYPADVIYPINQTSDFEPEVLSEIASKIFRLKSTEPTDPLLLKVANHMTDECDRAFGLFVPSNFCLNIPCELSTIFVNRQHLPNGYLSRGLFPLIISSEQPKIAMILPSRFWPSAMVDWWVG